MRFRVVNVVARGEFGEPVDLSKALKRGEFGTRGGFPGILWRGGGCSALVFESGRFVVVGAKSPEDVKRAARKLAKALRRAKAVRRGEYDVEVTNIVGKGHLGGRVNLEVYAEKAERAFYEMEVFPAVIKRLEGATALIFHTGNFVLAGAKAPEEAERLARKLAEEVRALGALA